MYNHDRLVEWLRESIARKLTADQLRDELAAEMNRFRAGAPLRDDQAFLILAEQPAVPGAAASQDSATTPSYSEAAQVEAAPVNAP